MNCLVTIFGLMCIFVGFSVSFLVVCWVVSYLLICFVGVCCIFDVTDGLRCFEFDFVGVVYFVG